MAAFAIWLHHTPLSRLFQDEVRWLWPLCETLHFAGLALLLGIAGMFDLRLLGLMKRVPIRAVQEFMPWALAGFAVNLTTGLVFVISEPAQYFSNRTWWLKVAFLLVSGVNAGVFQFVFAPDLDQVATEADTPFAFKVIGAVSLCAWLGVLWAGRMLPFIGASVGAGL